MDHLSEEQARELKAALARLESKIDRVEHLLTGNSEPEKGIIVQLHQLKQSQAMLVKVAWILFTAFAGALFTMGFKLFTLLPK